MNASLSKAKNSISFFDLKEAKNFSKFISKVSILLEKILSIFNKDLSKDASVFKDNL